MGPYPDPPKGVTKRHKLFIAVLEPVQCAFGVLHIGIAREKGPSPFHSGSDTLFVAM